MRSPARLGAEMVVAFERILRDEEDLAEAIATNDTAKVIFLSLRLKRHLHRAGEAVERFRKAVRP